MRRLFAIAILLAACKKEHAPTHWTGVGPDASCAWRETVHASDTTGTCIAGGRAYTCVWRNSVPFGEDSERSEVTCAPMIGEPDTETQRGAR